MRPIQVLSEDTGLFSCHMTGTDVPCLVPDLYSEEHLMVYTPSEAAKAVGKTKTTILRAIRNGKISAEKDAHGRWRIEPSELHRVYPIGTYVPEHNETNVPMRTSASDTELVAARAELAAALATISALESERDFLRADVEAWRAQAQRKLLTWRGLFGGRGTAE